MFKTRTLEMIDDLRIGHFVNVSSLFKIAPVDKKKVKNDLIDF